MLQEASVASPGPGSQWRAWTTEAPKIQGPPIAACRGLQGRSMMSLNQIYKMTVEGCGQAYPRLKNCGRLTRNRNAEKEREKKGEKREMRTTLLGCLDRLRLGSSCPERALSIVEAKPERTRSVPLLFVREGRVSGAASSGCHPDRMFESTAEPSILTCRCRPTAEPLTLGFWAFGRCPTTFFELAPELVLIPRPPCSPARTAQRVSTDDLHCES